MSQGHFVHKSQIPHELTWNRDLAAAVGSCLLNYCAIEPSNTDLRSNGVTVRTVHWKLTPDVTHLCTGSIHCRCVHDCVFRC
jgi:hypothetical protein